MKVSSDRHEIVTMKGPQMVGERLEDNARTDTSMLDERGSSVHKTDEAL